VFSDYPAEAKLLAMGQKRFFSQVFCAACVGRQKPNSIGLLTVAREMSLTPECTLYIGDRSIDLEAAAKAGMQGIIVRGRNSYPILSQHFAAKRHSAEDILK
jgi:HAD superfamily hydrolase (TIGR01509 family)